MKTYIKFLSIIFFKSFFYVTLVMLSLVFILNIISELEFFNEINVGVDFTLLLSLLNSPSMIFEMFPFIFLITTQFFFIKLFNNNELEVFKYSGLKNSNILKIISIISFISGVIIIIIFYNFSANLKNFYLEKKSQYTTDGKYLAVITKNGLWIKDEIDEKIYIINSSKIDNNFLINNFITEFNNKFEVLRNIQSERIDIKKKKWIILDAKVYDKNNYEVKKILKLKSNFDYKRIKSLYSNLSSLTLFELRKLKRDYKELGYSSIEIDAQNHKLYSFPFFIVLMTLFSGIIMINIGYNKSKLMHLIIGIFFSVTIYYFTYFSHTLGENEKIPVILSIWMPLVLLTLLCSVGLVKINDK